MSETNGKLQKGLIIPTFLSRTFVEGNTAYCLLSVPQN